MDNFSGDAEAPIKEATSKTTKEATGIEKNNFLSVLNQEYSRLPNSFSVEDSLSSGFDLLRKETLEKNLEIGGILFSDNKNELKVKTINPTKDSNSSNVVRIDCININEKNIEGPLYWESKSFGLNKYGHDAYFVNSELADKYRHFFEKLIRDGRDVLIGKSLIARIHSHPSSNLPSFGDFDHVLMSSGDGKQIPEVILTENWMYFLVPTRQTPDLSVGPDGVYKMKNLLNEWDQNEEEENKTIDHLLATSQKGNSEERRSKALNAVRLKNITDKCLKYNVGFYTLAKGESVAKRII